MALHLEDCSFAGPALPEPFVKLELEALLAKKGLLARTTGKEGQALADSWDVLRRKLRALGEQGGDRRVASHVLEPLTERLGYGAFTQAEDVETREGVEDGGWLLSGADGAHLRAWSVGLGTDLDAPSRRGHAYRFSPSRVAERVLLASGERVGLLTDGDELRLLFCDPARPDSHVSIRLDRSGGWRAARAVPDSYRLLLALASPLGVATLPGLVDAARLAQSGVTKKLRQQARTAVERFVQGVLDHPDNASARAALPEPQALAHDLWTEGLVLIYRLLFVLKLESSPDPARAFSFAGTSLWRNTYSPNVALGEIARAVLDEGAETGGMLEGGLRALFRLFSQGLRSSELEVAPLGGMLFGADAMPTLDRLVWGEQAVAHLLDALLWTPTSKDQRERVHYGALDVEDLGRVYEALLELEPGIATEPMCRLRRAKLEVVLPAAQGEPYRTNSAGTGAEGDDGEDDDEDDEAGDDAEERPRRGKRAAKAGKTAVQWIEPIPEGRFFLRVGLGRKASGSYYTPHPFVRFLVQETLGPAIAERSPTTDPSPAAILALKVLDPAMGSGHFLVEACRYLGEALYEACRLCDERALEAERQAESAKDPADRERHRARAADLRRRVEDLPDPNDELVAYLPSRIPEAEASGLSQRKALALCRRLVAVHCLYGVDKNPLAVALAKVSIWLESHAEGLPHTFVDHRLVCGDSLTGPFFEQILTYPRSGKRLQGLFVQGLAERVRRALSDALSHVRELEATVGTNVSDLVAKQASKDALDRGLAPLRTLAAAWTGSVMLGDEADDEAYEALVQAVADEVPLEKALSVPAMARSQQVSHGAVSFDLAFPEVFHPGGAAERVGGFNAVIANPPWERINVSELEFWSQYDAAVLDSATLADRQKRQEELTTPARTAAFRDLEARYEGELAIRDRLYSAQTAKALGESTRGSPDTWKLFAERIAELRSSAGIVGFVVPSSFHANEGATGIRQRYLDDVGVRACFSFENHLRKFFDIDPRFKIDLVVGGQAEAEFAARFYLRDDGWLFSDRKDAINYSRPFIAETGGPHLTFVELTAPPDAAVLRAMLASAKGRTLGTLRAELGIDIRQEINITRGAALFLRRQDVLPDGDPRDAAMLAGLISRGLFTVDDDKTFHQFTDIWARWLPRYLSSVDRLTGRPDLLEAIQHYRLAVRKTTGGRNERTAIFALLPPGHLATDKSPAERTPTRRPTAGALTFLALVNSFPCDWLARLRVQTDMNMFMLDAGPAPEANPAVDRFLAHAALRLTCSHAGYAALWHEQLGDAWREPTAPNTWPVLGGDDARWSVRAAIDAVVAHAYGLDRAQYEHVLASFSHKTYPGAPTPCLTAFDEIVTLGLDAFTTEHDLYRDLPLVDTLPEPVIEIPGRSVPHSQAGQLALSFDGAPAGGRAARSRGRPAGRTRVAKP